MNVDTAKTVTTSKTEATKASTTNATTNSKESSTTFKDELEAVKTQDTKAAETAEATKTQNNTDEKNIQTTEQEKNVKENTELTAKIEKNQISDPLKELNSKIATLNELKNGLNKKTNEIGTSKTEESKDKTNYCQTLKMDNNDINFFVNLVENKTMLAQNAQGINSNVNNQNMFTDIKTESAQSTVKVSATLLDAINNSAKTNKPFRIDFDNDIAVIMKVDKDGVLSANFIPGSSAVENYLRNNIAGLRQSFEEQNLPYNELSYSQNQKQEQQENQSKNNKENENE